MMQNKRIIYWRDYPIDVEIGLYRELSGWYKKEIVAICSRDLPSERKKVNFESNSLKNIKTIIIDNNVDDLIKTYADDIHVFFGITGKNGKYLRKLIKYKKDIKFFIVAERPNVYGNFAKRIWCRITRFCYYKMCSIYYDKYLAGFLAMGKRGVDIYKKCGFPERKLFDFMYTLDECGKDIKQEKIKQIKFLYIGRFDDSTKGTDFIRYSFDRLDNYDYNLDLVGGYGKDCEKMLKWASKKEKVNYIGKWDQKDVISKMQQYDICLVPSRYDGWNLAPNQVIDAGIGIIISDNATSDELVRYASNGIVYDHTSKKAFLNSIKSVLDNKAIITKWKNNSHDFKKSISNRLIGEYYLQVLDYCLNDYKKERPIPPWKRKKIN